MLTITRSKHFDKVFRRGQSASCAELVLYAWCHARPGRRVAFCVSKKLGCAVIRNRSRRRMREVYRLNRDRLDVRCDLILLARSATRTVKFAVLERQFLRLAGQLKVLRDPVMEESRRQPDL